MLEGVSSSITPASEGGSQSITLTSEEGLPSIPASEGDFPPTHQGSSHDSKTDCNDVYDDPPPPVDVDNTCLVININVTEDPSIDIETPLHIPIPAPRHRTPLPKTQPPILQHTEFSPNKTGRICAPNKRYLESIQQDFQWACSSYYDAHHEEDYRIQDEIQDPISFATRSDSDTMYYYQAIRQPDRKQFINAMADKLNEHIRRGHWSLIPVSSIPPNTRILDSVWSIKRKREIITHRIHKWKARLNLHGGQQEKDVDYNNTYSPVVAWFYIRILLTLAIINNWHTRQIDFMLDFPQATIEIDLYMKLHAGTILVEGNSETHVLLLHENLYGQKKSDQVWNTHLDKGLREIVFVKSNIGF